MQVFLSTYLHVVVLIESIQVKDIKLHSISNLSNQNNP